MNKTNARLQKIADFAHIYLNESYQKRSQEAKANLDRYLSGESEW